MYPSKRDWLFSVKTFAAAMLALYLALLFELPRPYWAMASVYVVSNPFVGATRSKALYRALGTLLGASAAVFFVPLLVDTPLLLSLAVATWTGSLLFLALTDRTARSYVFMLAGYTLPLIAFPVVNDPATVFDVAVARSEEIILGIVCASAVNSALFPNRLGAALGERTGAWFNDAVAYARETLSGRIVGKDLSAARQRLATSVNGLEFLLSQLAYDDTQPDVLRRAHALRGRMALLLPIASALGDPLAALRAQGAIPAELESLLVDITQWIGSKDGALRDREADSLRVRLDALEPQVMRVPGPGDTRASAAGVSIGAATVAPPDADAAPDAPALAEVPNVPAWTGMPVTLALEEDGNAKGAGKADDAADAADAPGTPDNAALPATERVDQSIAAAPYLNPNWDRALLSSLLWRLRLMVDLWQDCRALREMIETETSAAWRPHLRHWRLGGAERHIDLTMMFLSVLPAVGTTLLAAAIWIMTGWADGAGAVTLAAVACSFFAALDQPAPQVFSFFIWTLVSSVLAGIYLFLVLPNAHDFPMLVLMFAVPFICVGTLIPQPRFTLATMLTSVNTATFLSIQSAYDANFTSFLNSNMAGCAGLLFAFLCTRITRPFGAEMAAGRLTRAGWSDIVLAASPHAIVAQNNMASRMLDRLMQLLPRLGASDDQRHPSIDSFRDLRVGLNALDLQHVRRTLREERRMPIDQVLAGVRAYFQGCIDARERLPTPPELAERIDAALASDPDSRGALHALVGLRLSLFPIATAPVAGGPTLETAA
ncbi:FUSC family protein [Robbsia sp. Bb-Pol-6]|uniref:FUSC family protein n=1 Tax=Robbsia betulipollinis TaxID=2981849 RepID=A0ABT3ZIB7_9BURK|nr:FUSC family protein [Robbsia betulipollinis]MCY0385685.1 FUSC family protein [Robbsia betulipollinis]